MPRRDILDRRLGRLQRKLAGGDPLTFTLEDGTTEYPCGYSVVGRRESIEVGGLAVDIRARMWVRRSDLGEQTIVSGDMITLTETGTEFRVALVEDVESTLYQVHLADPES